MQRDQDIKGFTILELLVVITIVAIISAISFPNFSKWRTEREVRTATEKVASMISNISTQTQRGTFSYSQLMIKIVNINNKKVPVFVSKGMSDKNFKNYLQSGQINCPIRNTGYWDKYESSSKNIDGQKYSEFYEFYNPNDKVIGEAKIGIHFSRTSAICFGKGGSYYKAVEALSKASNINVALDGGVTPNYIVICTEKTAKDNGFVCPIKGTKLKQPAYLIKWSRFGNVSKFKWKENKNAWERQ